MGRKPVKSFLDDLKGPALTVGLLLLIAAAGYLYGGKRSAIGWVVFAWFGWIVLSLVVVIGGCLGIVIWHWLFEPCPHGRSKRWRRVRPCEACKLEEERRQEEYEEHSRRIAEEREAARLRDIRAREEERMRRTKLEFLRAVEPRKFEEWILDLFCHKGWTGHTTGATGDEGVDVHIERNGEVVVIQCKRYGPDKRVGAPVLRDLLGTVVAECADRGILVTTSSFTAEAVEWCKNKAGSRLELINGEELVSMFQRIAPRDDGGQKSDQ